MEAGDRTWQQKSYFPTVCNNIRVLKYPTPRTNREWLRRVFIKENYLLLVVMLNTGSVPPSIFRQYNVVMFLLGIYKVEL